MVEKSTMTNQNVLSKTHLENGMLSFGGKAGSLKIFFYGPLKHEERGMGGRRGK